MYTWGVEGKYKVVRKNSYQTSLNCFVHPNKFQPALPSNVRKCHNYAYEFSNFASNIFLCSPSPGLSTAPLFNALIPLSFSSCIRSRGTALLLFHSIVLAQNLHRNTYSRIYLQNSGTRYSLTLTSHTTNVI